jgi:hypothetical protein
MTKYTCWGERPCLSLLKDFCLGLKAGLKHRMFPQADAPLAETLLSRLERIQEQQTRAPVVQTAATVSAAYCFQGEPAAAFTHLGKREVEEGQVETEQAHALNEHSSADLNGSPVRAPSGTVLEGTGGKAGAVWGTLVRGAWTVMDRLCSWMRQRKTGSKL